MAGIYCGDERISVCLRHCDSLSSLATVQGSSSTFEQTTSDQRYLLCPANVTIGHLKKYVVLKFGLQQNQQVEMFVGCESLEDDFTLMDVAYAFFQKKTPCMTIHYIVGSLVTSWQYSTLSEKSSHTAEQKSPLPTTPSRTRKNKVPATPSTPCPEVPVSPGLRAARRSRRRSSSHSRVTISSEVSAEIRTDSVSSIQNDTELLVETDDDSNSDAMCAYDDDSCYDTALCDEVADMAEETSENAEVCQLHGVQEYCASEPLASRTTGSHLEDGTKTGSVLALMKEQQPAGEERVMSSVLDANLRDLSNLMDDSTSELRQNDLYNNNSPASVHWIQKSCVPTASVGDSDLSIQDAVTAKLLQSTELSDASSDIDVEIRNIVANVTSNNSNNDAHSTTDDCADEDQCCSPAVSSPYQHSASGTLPVTDVQTTGVQHCKMDHDPRPCSVLSRTCSSSDGFQLPVLIQSDMEKMNPHEASPAVEFDVTSTVVESTAIVHSPLPTGPTYRAVDSCVSTGEVGSARLGPVICSSVSYLRNWSNTSICATSNDRLLPTQPIVSVDKPCSLAELNSITSTALVATECQTSPVTTLKCATVETLAGSDLRMSVQSSCATNTVERRIGHLYVGNTQQVLDSSREVNCGNMVKSSCSSAPVPLITCVVVAKGAENTVVSSDTVSIGTDCVNNTQSHQKTLQSGSCSMSQESASRSDGFLLSCDPSSLSNNNKSHARERTVPNSAQANQPGNSTKAMSNDLENAVYAIVPSSKDFRLAANLKNAVSETSTNDETHLEMPGMKICGSSTIGTTSCVSSTATSAASLLTSSVVSAQPSAAVDSTSVPITSAGRASVATQTNDLLIDRYFRRRTNPINSFLVGGKYVRGNGCSGVSGGVLKDRLLRTLPKTTIQTTAVSHTAYTFTAPASSTSHSTANAVLFTPGQGTPVIVPAVTPLTINGKSTFLITLPANFTLPTTVGGTVVCPSTATTNSGLSKFCSLPASAVAGGQLIIRPGSSSTVAPVNGIRSSVTFGAPIQLVVASSPTNSSTLPCITLTSKAPLQTVVRHTVPVSEKSCHNVGLVPERSVQSPVDHRVSSVQSGCVEGTPTTVHQKITTLTLSSLVSETRQNAASSSSVQQLPNSSIGAVSCMSAVTSVNNTVPVLPASASSTHHSATLGCTSPVLATACRTPCAVVGPRNSPVHSSSMSVSASHFETVKSTGARHLTIASLPQVALPKKSPEITSPNTNCMDCPGAANVTTSACKLASAAVVASSSGTRMSSRASDSNMNKQPVHAEGAPVRLIRAILERNLSGPLAIYGDDARSNMLDYGPDEVVSAVDVNSTNEASDSGLVNGRVSKQASSCVATKGKQSTIAESQLKSPQCLTVSTSVSNGHNTASLSCFQQHQLSAVRQPANNRNSVQHHTSVSSSSSTRKPTYQRSINITTEGVCRGNQRPAVVTQQRPYQTVTSQHSVQPSSAAPATAVKRRAAPLAASTNVTVPTKRLRTTVDCSTAATVNGNKQPGPAVTIGSGGRSGNSGSSRPNTVATMLLARSNQQRAAAAAAKTSSGTAVVSVSAGDGVDAAIGQQSDVEMQQSASPAVAAKSAYSDGVTTVINVIHTSVSDIYMDCRTGSGGGTCSLVQQQRPSLSPVQASVAAGSVRPATGDEQPPPQQQLQQQQMPPSTMTAGLVGRSSTTMRSGIVALPKKVYAYLGSAMSHEHIAAVRENAAASVGGGVSSTIQSVSPPLSSIIPSGMTSPSEVRGRRTTREDDGPTDSSCRQRLHQQRQQPATASPDVPDDGPIRQLRMMCSGLAFGSGAGNVELSSRP
jgi:hypothetical protein